MNIKTVSALLGVSRHTLAAMRMRCSGAFGLVTAAGQGAHPGGGVHEVRLPVRPQFSQRGRVYRQLQLAAAALPGGLHPRELMLEFDTTHNLFRDELLKEPLYIQGQVRRNQGCAKAPDGSGLGVGTGFRVYPALQPFVKAADGFRRGAPGNS